MALKGDGLSKFTDHVHESLLSTSPTTVALPIVELLDGVDKLSLDLQDPPANKRDDMKKQVSFSKMSVREYNLVVGDKPSLAVELGWNVRTEYSEAIETYESQRKPRRSGDELMLRRKQKRDRLKLTGCSDTELWLAEREKQLRERAEFFGSHSRFGNKR